MCVRKDYWGLGGYFEGIFAGVHFQEQVERAAYAAGGGKFVAPASRVPRVAVPDHSVARIDLHHHATAIGQQRALMAALTAIFGTRY